MYQSIHVTAGYSHFKISSDGPIGTSKKNQGVIDVLLKLGNRFTAPFGGFTEAENVVGLKWVKLVDIKHLCTDGEAETIEYVIQKYHYEWGRIKAGSPSRRSLSRYQRSDGKRPSSCVLWLFISKLVPQWLLTH